jgi:hypothetical protein
VFPDRSKLPHAFEGGTDMIETLAGFPDNVIAFAAHGHVTRSD